MSVLPHGGADGIAIEQRQQRTRRERFLRIAAATADTSATGKVVAAVETPEKKKAPEDKAEGAAVRGVARDAGLSKGVLRQGRAKVWAYSW